MGEALALCAPGVEEFARERRARLDFGDHVIGAEHERDGAVAGGLLGLAFGRGEAAIANRDQRAFRATADGVGALQNRGHAGADASRSYRTRESRPGAGWRRR